MPNINKHVGSSSCALEVAYIRYEKKTVSTYVGWGTGARVILYDQWWEVIFHLQYKQNNTDWHRWSSKLLKNFQKGIK